MIERCSDCDRPLATADDEKQYPPGEGEHLCWRNFANDTCEGEPVDWRARCLRSEAAIWKVREVFSREPTPHSLLNDDYVPTTRVEWLNAIHNIVFDTTFLSVAKVVEPSAMEILLDAPVLFGLVAQGHIPKIQEMLAADNGWKEIGQEIGWDPQTAKDQFEAILAEKAGR